MKAKSYRSYSTELKLAVVNGKSCEVNYSTAYYWSSKGKSKILESERDNSFYDKGQESIDHSAELKLILNQVFDFFVKIIEQKKSLAVIYRKQRIQLVQVAAKLIRYLKPLEICNLFNISERTFYNWKNRPICSMTISKECPNSNPNQLTNQERDFIKERYFESEAFDDYSTTDLYAQMLKDKKLIVSPTLFYELVNHHAENEKRKPVKNTFKNKGLKAAYPKQILQMDKSLYKTSDGKRPWFYLLIDNRSRAIIGHRVSLKSESKQTLINLKESLKKYDLLSTSFILVSDDGSENKGAVKRFLKTFPAIRHEIAQLTIEESNSMIEAVIKTIKQKYLKYRPFKNVTEFKKELEIAIHKYNNRPKIILNGQTPMEVFNGFETDMTEIKKIQKNCREERLRQNREFSCLKTITCKLPFAT